MHTAVPPKRLLSNLRTVRQQHGANDLEMRRDSKTMTQSTSHKDGTMPLVLTQSVANWTFTEKFVL